MAGVTGVLGGFRDFLMRGNVVELAVAVVIGAAFTNIVNAMVEGVINPVVGAFGTRDLSAYELCLRGDCAGDSGVAIRWGSVVSATLTFLITAAVVYFLMILPLTRFVARMRRKEETGEVAPLPTELDLLTEIRDELIARRTGRPVATVGAQRSGETEPPAGPAAGPVRE
ncbi:large conductance mechanosensitive channel protein MscL [Streptomyces sp. 8K308]|nr:large conductance mechanosensitive channel protein MscL [Streptomyces sp. 8K308]